MLVIFYGINRLSSNFKTITINEFVNIIESTEALMFNDFGGLPFSVH